MSIKKALNRLIWRFKPEGGKYKGFTPNDNDVAALNEIIEYVNKSRAEVVEQNQGFAKMYIMAYGWYLDHYGDGDKPASVMSVIPNKELNKTLNKPMEVFYRRFAQKINERESFALMDQIKEGKIKKEELSEEQLNILTDGAWDIETVRQTLNAMIAEAFIKFGGT